MKQERSALSYEKILHLLNNIKVAYLIPEYLNV